MMQINKTNRYTAEYVDNIPIPLVHTVIYDEDEATFII